MQTASGERGTTPPLPRRAAVAAASLLLLAGCTVGPSTRPELVTSGGAAPAPTTDTTVTIPPTGPGGPGRPPQQLEWVPCTPDVSPRAPDSQGQQVDLDISCADMEVPLVHDDTRRGHFVIPLARSTPATVDTAPTPPLLMLVGSPGEHGHRDLASLAALLSEPVRQRYDVIVMDLRGTGDAVPITCIDRSSAQALIALGPDPAQPEGAARLSAASRQLTFACGDMIGPPLTQFNSTNAADDIDALRAALGTDTISVLGIGDGATIGAVYAHRYPGRVDRAVLVAPADPLTDPATDARQMAAATADLFADFGAACPYLDNGCPLGDDPATAVSDLVGTLGTGGIDADGFVVTGGTVLLALQRILPYEDDWAALADALAQLRDGTAAPLLDVLLQRWGGTWDGWGDRLAGELIYRCNDRPARWLPDEVERLARGAAASQPLFGPYVVGWEALCADWPTPEAPLGALTATGAAPLLVIGSTGSPLHPYPQARSLAGQLASATLVSWQSARDDAYPTSRCVTDIVDDYLLAGSTPRRGTLCPP